MTAETTVETTGWEVWSDERFELGEGLRLVGDRLVMTDILSGRLLELPADGSAPPRVLTELDRPLGAVAPHADGGWVAAAGTGVTRLPEDGTTIGLAGPECRMNDAVADPAGRFWAGSMAWDATEGAGALHRVDPDGGVTTALSGLTVPNGPAFDASGSVMYLADSARGLILRVDVDPGTGELGPASTFAEVTTGSPDGMTVDDRGRLWSAVWGGGVVLVFTPDGRVEQEIAVPARQPTSVCLTGTHLVVTTAWHGLDGPGRADGALFARPCAVAAPPVRVARTAVRGRHRQPTERFTDIRRTSAPPGRWSMSPSGEERPGS
ncbi:SMP-30/gluconolactonase/LRE family protein [Pseudonocardia nematodicida]|uniref:SMP-30/gluconolactonase/LRE family protein n=1 Tax=Pseudonocardia nematodicida TaxID=1206997 RepID=A0ABV1K5D2_9PSEU